MQEQVIEQLAIKIANLEIVNAQLLVENTQLKAKRQTGLDK